MADTFPYYLILLTAAVPAMVRDARKPGHGWLLFYVLLVLFVGLRYRVGSDWEGYLQLTDMAAAESFTEAITRHGDPLFFLILWASVHADFDVYGANVVTSAIFLYGVFCYCRTMPNRWLALYCALPFLVIVIGMSANRQAAAIGVTLYLLGTWKRSSIFKRLLLIIVGASLHASAGIFFILLILDSRISLPKKIVATIAVIVALSYLVAGADPLARYTESYVESAGENYAAGAIQQILLNAIPAVVLLAGWRRFRLHVPQFRFIVVMSVAALGLIPLAAVYSVAAARISFYLFPISIAVLSSIPDLSTRGDKRPLLRCMVILYGALTLASWLTFANHAYNHKPYDNVLLRDL